jgi:hypothetical protein
MYCHVCIFTPKTLKTNKMQPTRKELVGAVDVLTHCSLSWSVSFLSELLLALEENRFFSEQLGEEVVDQIGENEVSTALEKSQILVARSYFSLRQYQRVSPLLCNCETLEATFLNLYSRFLNGERRREEEAQQMVEEVQQTVVNRELSSLRNQLASICAEKKKNRFFGLILYLYGIVLRNLKNHDEARKGILFPFFYFSTFFYCVSFSPRIS